MYFAGIFVPIGIDLPVPSVWPLVITSQLALLREFTKLADTGNRRLIASRSVNLFD